MLHSQEDSSVIGLLVNNTSWGTVRGLTKLMWHKSITISGVVPVLAIKAGEPGVCPPSRMGSPGAYSRKHFLISIKIVSVKIFWVQLLLQTIVVIFFFILTLVSLYNSPVYLKYLLTNFVKISTINCQWAFILIWFQNFVKSIWEKLNKLYNKGKRSYMSLNALFSSVWMYVILLEYTSDAV